VSISIEFSPQWCKNRIDQVNFQIFFLVRLIRHDFIPKLFNPTHTIRQINKNKTVRKKKHCLFWTEVLIVGAGPNVVLDTRQWVGRRGVSLCCGREIGRLRLRRKQLQHQARTRQHYRRLGFATWNKSGWGGSDHSNGCRLFSLDTIAMNGPVWNAIFLSSRDSRVKELAHCLECRRIYSQNTPKVWFEAGPLRRKSERNWIPSRLIFLHELVTFSQTDDGVMQHKRPADRRV